MSTELMRATQVSITISVQVITDRETEWLTFIFFLLTPFLFLWRAQQSLNRLGRQLVILIEDMKDFFAFMSKVVIITLKAFAFGLGVD